jgi:hypothetical protein
LSTPGKSRLRKNDNVAAVDDFYEAIGRLIYNLYATENLRLTLKSLLPLNTTLSREARLSLWKLLLNLGFR